MFLISGFCGLLYQVIWLRLAFTEFGVITPVISVVLSVFMFGLAIGSWATGKFVGPLTAKLKLNPIVLYGVAEMLIGVGAFVVPELFKISSQTLLHSGEMDSVQYLLNSAILIMTCILPWCFLMGTTFPLMIDFIKIKNAKDTSSFSYLYLANVIGAMCGTIFTALVFVETFGFKGSLLVGATGNFVIGFLSFWLAFKTRSIQNKNQEMQNNNDFHSTVDYQPKKRGLIFGILFTTGFCSMAMEVVWTRALTPITQTTIYAFAFLLAIYLCATWVGSYYYRKHLVLLKLKSITTVVCLLSITALFPLIFTDSRIKPNILHILVSLFPFCALLGYLTPQLIDRYSNGFAKYVGSSYGINILGCILGPLCAGYVLLPFMGVKWSLLLLALPLFVFAVYLSWKEKSKFYRVKFIVPTIAFLVMALFAKTYEDRAIGSHDEVRRDTTATVISTGEGMEKRLLVNGIGITIMTPITKIMAHLPLSMLKEKPDSALVICFGMGTTFRSLVSWGIDVTAVELVPSVKEAFGYYFSDAAQVMSRENVRVVVDDGRRFLRRTKKKYDLITLDPPPPLEAAGSSLLYSRQFYDEVKNSLKPKGILQQWFPGGDSKTFHSFARAIKDAFPYVKVYHSIEEWGYHFIASNEPITTESETQLIAKIPTSAQADLMEWFPGKNIHQIYQQILSKEIPIETAIGNDNVPMLSDTRPFNEYFILRRANDWLHNDYVIAK
jgi:spermidine synthase